MKKSKEEKEEERKKELLRTLRRSPDLDRFICEQKRTYVTYGEYEMISGHRRLFAIKQIGFDTIPAIIKNYSDIRNNLCSRSCNLADVGSYSFLDRYLERIVGKM